MFDKDCRRLESSDGTMIYLLAIFADIAVQLLASAALSAFRFADGASATLNAAFMLVIQLAFLAVVLIVVNVKKRPIGLRPVFPGAVPLVFAPVVAVIAIVCFVLPAEWFSVLLKNTGYVSSVSLSLSAPLDIAITAVATVVVAPVVEELVFRGALLGGLVKKQSAPAAIVASGFAFAMMHMNPDQTVYQFFLGCVCAYMALCSRSVVPAMAIHSCNNLIALILEFVPAGEAGADITSFPALTVPLTFVLAAVGMAAVYFIGRFVSRRGRVQEFVSAMHAEQAEDDRAVAEGKRRGALLGRRSHVVQLCLGLGVCAFMWIMVLAVGYLPQTV